MIGAAQRQSDGGGGTCDGPVLCLPGGRRQGALRREGDAEPDDDADAAGTACEILRWSNCALGAICARRSTAAKRPSSAGRPRLARQPARHGLHLPTQEAQTPVSPSAHFSWMVLPVVDTAFYPKSVLTASHGSPRHCFVMLPTSAMMPAGSMSQANVRLWPILLQKSFCTGDQKFCGLQARLWCKDVREPHRLTLNSQATSVVRLRLYESAIASCFVFSRKIRRPATFDFCNNIGP